MTTRDQKLALVGATLVALSMVSFAAPALGAAPTVDTETTDTVTTTALNGGDTVPFSANDSQNLSTLQFSVDSQNPAVRIMDPSRDNTTVASYDSGDMVQTGSASGTYYYNLSVPEDDLRYFEVDAASENPSYWQLVNNTESATEDTTNLSITLNESADRTVRVVGDTTEGLEMTQSWSVAGFDIPLLSSTDADFEADSLPTADNGTVVLHAQNSTLTDGLDALSMDSESLITGMAVSVNGDLVPFYAEGNVPSDVEGAYAVADADSNDVMVHNIDGTSADVSVSTGGVGLLQSFWANTLGSYDGPGPLSIGGFASGMALMLPFGRRSLRSRMGA